MNGHIDDPAASTEELRRDRPGGALHRVVTRRMFLGGGLGLASAGVLGACTSSPTGFSLVQTAVGERVTTGRSVSARYSKAVQPGNFLVAVVSRQSTRVLAPTIGAVSDDSGNHWRQAVEYFGGSHYGVDLWYCEAAHSGGRPVVTGTGLGYPVEPGYTGIRMLLLEYAGASGYELCDQICQADITGSSVMATTNFGLTSDHELAISVVMGNMTGATVPEGWSTRQADGTQQCFVADTVDTGPSAGARLSAHWTDLRAADSGVAIVATFVPKGVSKSSRRLVQSSYTDSAILPAGQGHALWLSQPYPVDPVAGNTLVAFMNGAIFNPTIDCGSILTVTDSRGGHWYKADESGVDNHTGINISCWICDSAVGGPTTLTAHFSNSSQQLACLLLELANLPRTMHVERSVSRTFGGDNPPLETHLVSAGDVAFAFRTSIYVLPAGPGSSPWKQIMSDTTGANCLMDLNANAGELTARWSGRSLTGGLDILLIALNGAKP